MPDRIAFEMTSDKGEIAPGEAANVTVDGRFLYGAPAAGLALEGEISLSTMTEWERFPGYRFGLADEDEAEATRIALDDLPAVDAGRQGDVPGRDRAAAVDDADARRRGGGAHARRQRPGGRAHARHRAAPARARLSASSRSSGRPGPAGRARRVQGDRGRSRRHRRSLPGLAWSLVKIERKYQWYRSGNAGVTSR